MKKAELVAPDDRTGMAWWNALTDAARRFWMQQAGNTGRAVDAWGAYKLHAARKGVAELFCTRCGYRWEGARQLVARCPGCGGRNIVANETA